mmetsp:Transcript_31302/g.60376  ORF Transcript_31302/g.60376 Transcript_31302/m.60376 type:complete len:234 (-) Transcript_31302:259-960(-)
MNDTTTLPAAISTTFTLKLARPAASATTRLSSFRNSSSVELSTEARSIPPNLKLATMLCSASDQNGALGGDNGARSEGGGGRAGPGGGEASVALSPVLPVASRAPTATAASTIIPPSARIHFLLRRIHPPPFLAWSEPSPAATNACTGLGAPLGRSADVLARVGGGGGGANAGFAVEPSAPAPQLGPPFASATGFPSLDSLKDWRSREVLNSAGLFTGACGCRSGPAPESCAF